VTPIPPRWAWPGSQDRTSSYQRGEAREPVGVVVAGSVWSVRVEHPIEEIVETSAPDDVTRGRAVRREESRDERLRLLFDVEPPPVVWKRLRRMRVAPHGGDQIVDKPRASGGRIHAVRVPFVLSCCNSSSTAARGILTVRWPRRRARSRPLLMSA
jgi:hypothetical protein